MVLCFELKYLLSGVANLRNCINFFQELSFTYAMIFTELQTRVNENQDLFLTYAWQRVYIVSFGFKSIYSSNQAIFTAKEKKTTKAEFSETLHLRQSKNDTPYTDVEDISRIECGVFSLSKTFLLKRDLIGNGFYL